MTASKAVEGILGMSRPPSLFMFLLDRLLILILAAINKPQGITSAQVIRDLQRHFAPSKLFLPWLENERARRARESRGQKRRRRDKESAKVKIGHGGTLDPLATGVLIIGIGQGTKSLQGFLHCTKTYEAVVLFGVATDSYDRLGKVIGRAPYQHITREKVLDALKGFRGKQMQQPPIFSALRVQGKRLYEYAREGAEIPMEIKKRELQVDELELIEWLDGERHSHRWPTEDADSEEKAVAENILHITSDYGTTSLGGEQCELPLAQKKDDTGLFSSLLKRQREANEESDDSDRDLVFKSRRKSRRGYDKFEPVMSGGLPPSTESPVSSTKVTTTPVSSKTPSSSVPVPTSLTGGDNNVPFSIESSNPPPPPPPAIRIRMTVSSGFYVRSLCHDLGQALGSLGIMSELVRTRQGQFALKEYHASQIDGVEAQMAPVLDYQELDKGEEIWGDQVADMLARWNETESSLTPETAKEEGDFK